MTRLRQLIQTQPRLVIGFAFMIVLMLIIGSAFGFFYIRAYLSEDVVPDQPVVVNVETNENTGEADNDVEETASALPPDTTVTGYLFSSYGYNCRTGTIADGFTDNLQLELNFSIGTVSGGCHISEVAPGVNDERRTDYDIEGTLTPDGVITAQIIDGTHASITSGHDDEINWGLSGDFTGTVDLETMKASGEYSMTIDKYVGGTGRNPEVERLQWVARPDKK